MEGTPINEVVDFLEEPAFLVSGTGAVVFANTSAKRVYPKTPQWLAMVPSSPSSSSLEDLARVRRIDLTGREVWLVIPKLRAHGKSQQIEALEGLPPSLRRIAELVLSGLSDREIADRTGLTYRTVRTYMTRLYQRLGVTSRAKLIAKVLKG